jgi:nucleotide-binding universal stress UspA family protein
MSEDRSSQPSRSRIVVTVGVDLSDVSEHLLQQARDLVRSVEDAELHIVHVVRPESLRERLTEPIGSGGYSTRSLAESARWELERLCETIVQGSGARWLVHTPVGRTADELTRIARDVGSDVIVVETHDHARRRVFHRSVVARIVHLSTCSVLAIRDPKRAAARAAVAA